MGDKAAIDNGLLIALVKRKPVLWDRNNKLFKNRTAVKAAWVQIARILNPEYKTWERKTRKSFGKLIMKRWNHIRDNYYRSNAMIQTQNDTDSDKPKTYIHSKKLKFLEETIPQNEQVTVSRNEAESQVTANNVENQEVESQTKEKSEISENNDGMAVETATAENESTSPVHAGIHSIDTNSVNMDPNSNQEPETAVPIHATGTDTVNMDPTSNQELEPTVSVHTDINLTDVNTVHVDPSSNQDPEISNRHLSFFKAVLPSLEQFDDDETIDFQMGVLKLLRKIKINRQHEQQQLSTGQQATNKRRLDVVLIERRDLN